MNIKRLLTVTAALATFAATPLAYAAPAPQATNYGLTSSDKSVTAAEAAKYGAKVAYSRYEATNAELTKAKRVDSTGLESTAIEASNQSYVELSSKDSAVTFKVAEAADALTVRFTLPDGANGKLAVKVNGKTVSTLDLTSKHAWQYVDGSVAHNYKTANSKARFRFDEVHTLLGTNKVKAGDTISLVKVSDDSTAYGIDFIELEEAGAAIAKPAGAISITDKGAKANDGADDTAAFNSALEEAKKTEAKTVYIPAGQYDFNGKLGVNGQGIKIVGAGMWYSHIHFTADKQYGGGFNFDHNSNNIVLSDFYMSSELTNRYDETKEKAQYKAIAGSLGKDSKVKNLWIEHFECAAWIGDYAAAAERKDTNNLTIENSRIRNNLADGVNFAQGTINSKVINSSVRGNGDDSLASWASTDDRTKAPITENNKFLNNTIELGWRAAGVGFFGGKGHEVSGNLIKDVFSGAGIRVNTVFEGHNFDLNTSGISIHDNMLIRTGTSDDFYGKVRGSVDFERDRADIKGIAFTGNKIVAPFVTAETANFDLSNGANKIANNTVYAKYVPESAPASSNAKQVVNKDIDTGATLKENSNWKLYYYSHDQASNGTTVRYWRSKVKAIHVTKDMTYSKQGNLKVYNFTAGDIPQYLSEKSTKFVQDYKYEGEVKLDKSQNDNGEVALIRFWSHK